MKRKLDERSAKGSALQPVAETVAVREWHDDGARHVLVVAAIRPHPYHRTTQRAKWTDPRAKAYGAWRVRVRPQIEAAMRGVKAEPFTAGRKLGVSVNAGAKPSSPVTSKRTKSGAVDKRTILSIRDWDPDNVLKAVMDACNGILFADDKAVRAFGPMAFYDTSSDWFSIHAWGENAKGEFRLWDNLWDIEALNGPTEASDWL